jgi:protein transport protein SEC23
MCFGAEVQVLTSNELRVQGMVGHVTSLGRQSKSVAATSLGVGKTCAWRLGGIDPTSTVALLLTLNDKGAVGLTGQPSQQGYVQIATKYRHSSGQLRLRVTTASKAFTDASTDAGLHHLRCGFDQEAAAALVTRLAVSKLTEEPGVDIRRWVDRMLIKLCARFAKYTRDNPASFQLAPELVLFPQFMFYLRRSQMLQVFNCSPDETAFFRMVCQREDASSVLTMIQPRLYAYRLDSHPEPVLLDASSLATDRILLLDTFFHIIVWLGGSVAKWRADGLHKDPNYPNLAALLRAPLQAAKERIDARFPTPRFIECVENGSQARFLLAKLNPSTAPSDVAGGEPALFSEDVSLRTFHEHLRKLVTQQPQ